MYYTTIKRLLITAEVKEKESMQSRQGLILRTYIPKKHKVSLFDETLGRIEVMRSRNTPLDSLLSGMVITYHLFERPGQLYEIDGVSIQEVPLALARHDIYFFHHVLELCYYFLPLNLAASNIFDLVLFLIKSYEKICSDEHKKLFLLRFFLYLGMYPEEELCLDYLLYEPIDVMLSKTVIVSENKLEQWLLTCVQAHPQKTRFRTLIAGCNDALQSN